MVLTRPRVLRLKIDMEPVAKSRPRMNISNGKVRSYTPEKTQTAQDFLKVEMLPYLPFKIDAYIPVKLTVAFYRTKSKWAPRKDMLPVRKPDLDNFLKLVLDAMNGIIIEDDAQITAINVKKRWSVEGYGYMTLTIEEDMIDPEEESL